MPLVSTISPALLAWIYPGAKWFYNQLIPSPSNTAAMPSSHLEPKTLIAIWQLTNCSPGNIAALDYIF
jgi:hypothetical protein